MAHRILVVEDDPDTQGYATTALQNAGFSVSACENMREARAALKASPLDLAVVDIGLPDGSGLDLCRELASLRIPFVFLTGRGDLPSRLEAFSSGACDYIQKPFAVEELLARVKVHLRLKKFHDDLTKRNYDLELINRARQDLTDMIVHDLKTPLTSIKGTMELIKSRGLISDSSHKALLEAAGTTADFMLLMLNDLLDIGRAEQPELKVVKTSVGLRLLFDRIEALFASRCRNRRQALRCAAPGLTTIQTDHNLVFRILVNLISNAVKLSSEGAEIHVDVAAAPEGTRLSVSDRGPGVPDKDKALIFEKYAASPAEGRSLDSGTGIGLAFCRLAAHALRAKLTVTDRPGGGSVFSLLLPS